MSALYKTKEQSPWFFPGLVEKACDQLLSVGKKQEQMAIVYLQNLAPI